MFGRINASCRGEAGCANSTRSRAGRLTAPKQQTSGSFVFFPLHKCRTISPAGSPHPPLSAQSSRGFQWRRSIFPSLQCVRTIECRRPSGQSHWKSFGNRPCSISSRIRGVEVSWKGKESGVESNLNEGRKEHPEMEQAERLTSGFHEEHRRN